CYQIETDHNKLRFHGRLYHLSHGERMKRRGKRIRAKQLRDGDLFRCGTLCILVGTVPDLMDWSDGEPASGEYKARHRLHPDAPRSILRVNAEAHVAIVVYA